MNVLSCLDAGGRVLWIHHSQKVMDNSRVLGIKARHFNPSPLPLLSRQVLKFVCNLIRDSLSYINARCGIKNFGGEYALVIVELRTPHTTSQSLSMEANATSQQKQKKLL